MYRGGDHREGQQAKPQVATATYKSVNRSHFFYFDPLGPLVTVFECLPGWDYEGYHFHYNVTLIKQDLPKSSLTKSNRKIYLANDYNYVMIALYLQG